MHVARHPASHRPSARATLIGLHTFMAFWALVGMAYALRGAEGLNSAWLDSTPFNSFIGPGLILGVVVGGTHAVAAIALYVRAPRSDLVAAAAAIVLLLFMLEEVLMIGFVSVLQPAVFAYGAGLLYLALRFDASRS